MALLNRSCGTQVLGTACKSPKSLAMLSKHRVLLVKPNNILRLSVSSDRYASSSSLGTSSASSRKQVTVANDDGRVQWQDLSTREKAARTTQQTFNFAIVLAGFVGTVCLPLHWG